MGRRRERLRTAVQAAFAALSNGYAAGFAKGTIYKGQSKRLCLPGLSCYSCPGALGSCPIGAFQAVVTGRDHVFSFYVTGFLLLFGAVFGRFICGWLCPFGLVQDLFFKIPFSKKRKKLPGDGWLKYLKYGVLALFVILLPLAAADAVGQGQPWFCKYLCPSGTLLGGIPLVLTNSGLRSALGWLFTWKAVILVALLLLSVMIYRPFCRYLCPLGAIYGCFNSVSICRYRVDDEKCTACGQCREACPMDIPTFQTPNSQECIRCGRCKSACPRQCISSC